MRIRYKLFFLIFGASLLIVSLCFYLVYLKCERVALEDFVTKYEAVATMVRHSMAQQEHQLETSTLNAANVLKAHYEREGLPSQIRLKQISESLQTVRLSVIDENGFFIRDTNQDPTNMRLSLFKLCDDYRGLINGTKAWETTPIVPIKSSKGPYKFSMVPGKDRKFIFEAGIRADFIEKSLRSIIASDQNILSLGFYSPSGFSFAKVDKNGAASFGETDANLAAAGFTSVLSQNKTNLTLVSKIPAPVAHCCECRTKGIDAEDTSYFYKFAMVISTDQYNQRITGIRNIYFYQVAVSLVIALIASYIGSLLIARRLEHLNKGLDGVIRSGNIRTRINVKGKDEVATIAKHFNQSLAMLELTQSELIAKETQSAISTIASQVGKDLKTPISNLSSLIADVKDPEQHLKIRNHVNQIREVSEELSIRWRQRELNGNHQEHCTWANLFEVCNRLLQERTHDERCKDVMFHLQCASPLEQLKVHEAPKDLQTRIGRLLNELILEMSIKGEVFFRIECHGDVACLKLSNSLGTTRELSFSDNNSVTLGRPTILMDGDPWVRDAWLSALRSPNQRSIKTYATSEDLLNDIDQIERDALVFLSLNAPGSERYVLGEKIFNKGFRDIYLCTESDSPNISPLPHFIKGVISRNPPGWL